MSSAAVGAVTNIVTSRWNVALFVLLATLVLVGAALQILVTVLEGHASSLAAPVTHLRARASGRSHIVQVGRDLTVSRDPSRGADVWPGSDDERA
jgi:hypothetical protein